MDVIVQKYGGSSVSTIEKLEMVARRVVETRRKGHQVVVVVSAMGNTTDNLLGMARQIMPEPPVRELDMLLTTGERVSMSLLSIAIQKLGECAISFTGSQSGIVTTDSHANARIISVRPYRIQDELERGNIVIVAGFQGTSYRNEITTLGRGGSDMTAIALAGALNAKACEIYSDVDGVYTGDPRIILDAQKLDELSASEMLILAQHGAKVLHDEAIAYARKHQVALYAKATQKPDSPGTLIRPDGWPDYALEAARPHPTAIASLKKMLFIRGQASDFGAIRRWIEKKKVIKILSLGTSATECTAILDVWNCVNTEEEINELCSEISGIFCTTDYINLSLVGHDIGRERSIIASVLEIMERESVVLHYFEAASDAIVCVVNLADQVRASRALHALMTNKMPDKKQDNA